MMTTYNIRHSSAAQHQEPFSSNTLTHEHSHIPKKPLYKSNISDGVDCYTDFEPRYGSGVKMDLESRIVPNGHRWGKAIYEEFVDTNIIAKARSRGYLDYKYMFYGNKTSGVLSINIKVRKEGYMFMCQTPGNWGKLPKDFTYFWEVGTTIYLQPYHEAMITNNQSTYYMHMNDVELRHWDYFIDKPGDSQHVCVQFIEKVPKGKHVLNIVPSSEKNIIISMLILP